MRRFWTAIVLLFCVAAGSMYNLYTVSHTVRDLSSTLTQAGQAAERGDLDAAMRRAAQAQRDYQAHEPYLSAVISEKLLDEVRLGFARTQAGGQTGERAQFTLELSGLQQAVDDLLRAETVGFRNIF